MLYMLCIRMAQCTGYNFFLSANIPVGVYLFFIVEHLVSERLFLTDKDAGGGINQVRELSSLRQCEAISRRVRCYRWSTRRRAPWRRVGSWGQKVIRLLHLRQVNRQPRSHHLVHRRELRLVIHSVLPIQRRPLRFCHTLSASRVVPLP